MSAAAYSLRGEAATIVQQLPEAAQRLRTAIRKDRQANGGGTIEQVQKAAAELSRAANEAAASTPPPKGVQRVQIEEPAVKVSDYLWWSSAGIMAFAGQAVSVLFLVYFMLMSGDLFKRKLVQVTGPTLTKKKITVQILDEISGQIERFLFVQAFTSVLVGARQLDCVPLGGPRAGGRLGNRGGRVQLDPLLRPGRRHRRHRHRAFLQFGTIGMAASWRPSRWLSPASKASCSRRG